MATYPIKMMIDESGQPFVPLTSLDAVIGEKNLQYIINATETSAGHFNIIIKDVTLDQLKNTVVVVRWPQISSTVKPSYLQLNEEEEIILYNGSGTEYLDLEDASNTVNILAYDGEKWILTSGAGSGSGHIITDESGNTMEQQKVLNFVGFNVENDAGIRATKIINPAPINNLTTNESGMGSLDAYQGYILSGRSIPAGGNAGQVLSKKNGSDYQVEWIDRDGDDVIKSDGSIEEIIGLTYEEYKALEAAGNLKSTTQYHITDLSDGDIGFVSTDDIQSIVENNIVNNLSSDSTTNSLSAAQGKVLNDKIDNTSRLIAKATAEDFVNKLELSGLNLKPGTYEIIIAEYSNKSTGTGHVLRMNGATEGYQGIHMHPDALSEATADLTMRIAYHGNCLVYLNGWNMASQLNYGVYTLHYFNKDWITVTGTSYQVPYETSVHGQSGAVDGTWNTIYQQGSYNGHVTESISSFSIDSLDNTTIGPGSYIEIYKK